jgi:hypothetical protein
MIPSSHRQRGVLDDIKDQTMVASAMISAVEHALIDEACRSQCNDEVNTADIDSSQPCHFTDR